MAAFSYIRVKWLHNEPEDPVELWSELDAQLCEIRKVEVWQDGRVGFASQTAQSEATALSTVPLPSVDEIAADPQFKLEQISQVEFEKCWREKVHLD